MKKTREDVALLWLQRFGPLAAHEFNAREFTGYSENTLATGLSNLAALGKIECVRKKGNYKIWGAVASQLSLIQEQEDQWT